MGVPRYMCNLLYTSPNYWSLFSTLVEGNPYILGQVVMTEAPAPSTKRQTQSSAIEIENIQRAISSALVDISGFEFEKDAPLMEAGLDSLGVVELRNTISSSVGVQLPSTVILDYPSINALTAFICDELGLQESASTQKDLHAVLPSTEISLTRCVA